MTKMHCYNCGTENNEEREYCIKCKAPLLTRHAEKKEKKHGTSDFNIKALKETSPWLFFNAILFFIILGVLSDYSQILSPGILNFLKLASAAIASYFLYKWIYTKKILISEALKSIDKDDFDDF